MSDLSSPPTSTNGAATALFWQRITNKQVAIGTVLVALVLLSLGLIVALRYVFLMLFLGIVVATALTPVVERLRKFGLSQSTATLIAFGVLLAIIGGIAAALAPFFVVQFVQAFTDLPKFYAGFRTTISSSSSQFLRGIGAQLPADPFSGLAGDNGIALGSQVTLLLPSLGSTLLFTILVLILSYYWLYYRALAVQSIALLVPIDQRAGAVALWNEIETKIGAFVRGLAILGFVIGLLSGIGYVAIGLPYGLTIAIIAGILEAIPYVGPIITLVLAGLVGLSVSQNMALLAIGIAMVIQFLENSIVVPRVMDRAVGVSPVVTLLALAVFSDLFGLLGALLAVPLAAVFQVLLDRMMLGAVSPAALDIGGRDKLALLRYQTQDIANDLRGQVRSKTEDMDADVDAAEEELEALLLDLD
ncbi:MAG: AI-2E family transporter, partial [Roseiflexaceae bacterium]